MNERTCIVTRKTYPVEELIRFVVSPSGEILPDIKRNLPGRGVYILARKYLINKAITSSCLVNHFAHKLNKKNMSLTINPDTPDLIEKLLINKAVKSLSLGRKAGKITYGFNNCDKAIREHKVARMLHTIGTSSDSVNKISQAIFASKIDVKQEFIFTESDLEKAFGDLNIMHVAILHGNTTKYIVKNIDKLHIYRECFIII